MGWFYRYNEQKKNVKAAIINMYDQILKVYEHNEKRNGR